MGELATRFSKRARGPLRLCVLGVALVGAALSLGSGRTHRVHAADSPCSSTLPLSCGATHSGSITAPGEAQCFQFDAVAGEVVSVTTSETSAGLNACWDLVTSDGTSVGHACGEAITALAAGGTYTIQVHDNGGNGEGDYNVNLAVVSTEGSCAEPITCGTSGGDLVVAENATFRFSAPADEILKITTSGSNGTFNPCWALYDSDGNAVDRQCGARAAPVASGEYILRLFDNGDDAGGSYALTIECSGPAAATPSPSPSPTPTPTSPPRLDDPAVAKLTERCASVVGKSGLKFIDQKLTLLAKCTTGVSQCVQQVPTNPSCLAMASTRCQAQLNQIDAAEQAFLDTINAACGVLPAEALLGPAGMGYAGLAPPCMAEFASPVADASSALTCVVAAHDCRADDLAELEMPRAAESLRIAGLGGQRSSVAPCLHDLGGNGAALDDSQARASLRRCQKGISSAAAHFASTTLGNLQQCVTPAFACVESNPGDDHCTTKATARCAKRLAATDGAAGKLATTIVKACPQAVYDAMSAAGGLGLRASADECATYGFPTLTRPQDYAACVARQHECRAEELLRFEFPRADELLLTLAPAVAVGSASCPQPSLGPTPVGSPGPTPSPTATPFCGDGIVQAGEECDNGAANSDTTPDACRTNCKIAFCGDGVIDSFEDCEGRNLGGDTCLTLGYDGGTLSCGADCFFDDSRCTVNVD